MPGTEDSDRPLVELTHVEKHYGDLHVLKDINLTVKKGEVLVIVGPSGVPVVQPVRQQDNS